MAVRTAPSSARRTTPHALRSYSHWWGFYKGTWRGSLFTTLLVPLFNLLALGYGLGALIAAQGTVAGLAYPVFVAPGLLATAAMSTAVEESTFPVMGAVRWDRSYDAMLATPLKARDAFVGHLAWVLTRVAMGATGFLLVITLLGLVKSWTAILALPFAILVGLAFAAPVMAFAVTTENTQHFALLYRFGVVPLFLFSGAFFPITQLPEWMQLVARVTPTWHGVELCRAATTGTLELVPAATSIGYLLLWGGIGFVLAARFYQRRLVT